MRFGLLGEKLGHSYSPELHAFFGDYEYELFEVAPDQLGDFIRNGDFQGLNVTIPYKTTMLALCDDLTEAAAAIGSVNTVVRHPDGSLFGDNTDAAGFEGLVWKSRISIRGRKCLVLGSGGASLSVQYVLHKLGAGEIVVISRSGPDNYENLAKHADAEVIVNTTPVGMYPNCPATPVSREVMARLEGLAGVLDIVYNPERTELCLIAEELGIPSESGLAMLVGQARFSSELFQGHAIEDEFLEKIEDELRSLTRNVVLIGMPGAGKTSCGKRLARMLGRPFVDIDEAILADTGRGAAQIIQEDGEDAFRRVETEVTASYCKRSGMVIACGGGVVTRPQNRDLLRQNGRVVLVDRPLNELSDKGRPVSQAKGVERLAAERMHLYHEWADVILRCTGSAQSDAELVKELLRL